MCRCEMCGLWVCTCVECLGIVGVRVCTCVECLGIVCVCVHGWVVGVYMCGVPRDCGYVHVWSV